MTPTPPSLGELLRAATGDPDPLAREARVARYAERLDRTGAVWDTTPPRPVAELVAEELPHEEDLRDRAAVLDRYEARQRERAALAGVDEAELEDDEDA